jgi:hypothetical protein
MSQSPNKRRHFLYALYLIIASCVILLILDYIFGFIYPDSTAFDTRFPVQITRHPYPYIMFSGAPNIADHNKYGFRSPEPSVLKDDSEYRVFVLGGSTVYSGETPQTTIPGYLQKVIDSSMNCNNRKVEVFNWSVVSGGSGMELARIIYQIVDHKPDFIIMYNGGNDLGGPYYWDPRPGYPFNFCAYEANPLYSHSRFGLGAFLIARSALLGFTPFAGRAASWAIGLETIRAEVGYGSPHWKQAIIDQYLNNVEKARLIANAVGSKFKCFFQPMLIHKENYSPNEKRILAAQNKEFANYLLEMRLLFREGVKAREKMKDSIVDMSDVFTQRPEDIFTDMIHIRDEYNRTMADKIFEVIQQDLMRNCRTRASDRSHEVPNN